MTTTHNTAPEPDEPQGVDWVALNTEVFGTDARPTAPSYGLETETEGPVTEAHESEKSLKAPAPLDTGLKFIVGLVGLAVAMLAAIGFTVSFDTQTTAVEPYFGAMAPLVPLGIDLGILVFAALNLVLARLNLSVAWLRAVPWVLTAMTLYINLTAHEALIARVAHVALPGMWIIASEIATHVVKVRAGLEAGTRTESLGVMRWLLAPVTTARLWRHMRLWGLKTAEAARATEAQRLEAKAALRYRYRTWWRYTAPVQLRTAYRLRALTAEEVYTWIAPQITAEDIETSVEEAPTGERAPAPVPAEAKPATAGRKPTRSGKPRRSAAKVADTELIEQIQRLAEDVKEPLSVKRVRREFGLGDVRAKRLLEQATRPVTD